MPTKLLTGFPMLAAAGLLGACSASGNHAPKAAANASDAKQQQLLGRVQTLDGTWSVSSANPSEHPAGGAMDTIVFKTTSNGSAVREIMFPGTDHEMTNMYTMDGDSCLVTHYCALGNQPHMRARTSDGDSIDFRFESISNYHENPQGYMGGLKITFIDKTHVKQTWTNYKDGKAQAPFSFDLVRKQ